MFSISNIDDEKPEILHAIGWGTGENPELKMVHLELLPRSYCESLLKSCGLQLSSFEICAASFSDDHGRIMLICRYSRRRQRGSAVFHEKWNYDDYSDNKY